MPTQIFQRRPKQQLQSVLSSIQLQNDTFSQRLILSTLSPITERNRMERNGMESENLIA